MSDFLAEDRGAVSVDWVVLSAALVGLGLSVLSVTSGGLDTLANATADEIGGVSTRPTFGTTASLFDTNFSEGAMGWFGGTAVDLDGFGDVLQIGGGELAEVQVTVPSGATQATVQFDLIGANDLNGDQATIFVNGEPVSIYSDDHGDVSVFSSDVPGVSVSVDQQYTNDAAGAGSHGHDSRATFTVTVDNPGSSLTFGVGSNADDGISDEFYAIDDVSITSS